MNNVDTVPKTSISSTVNAQYHRDQVDPSKAIGNKILPTQTANGLWPNKIYPTPETKRPFLQQQDTIDSTYYQHTDALDKSNYYNTQGLEQIYEGKESQDDQYLSHQESVETYTEEGDSYFTFDNEVFKQYDFI